MKNKHKPSFSAADVDIVKKETLYQDYFRVDKYHLKHRTFEGGWTKVMDREIFERGHVVTIILIDPYRDETVLIEQFRPGSLFALDSPWWDKEIHSPWMYETIAGIIDEGETPEQVAIREAHEEAGCHVQQVIPVMQYLVSPGGSTESMYVFCGKVDSTKVGGIHGLEDEHENIRAFVIPVAEAFKMLDDGLIINAMTIINLQWLKANYDKVKEAFLKKS